MSQGLVLSGEECKSAQPRRRAEPRRSHFAVIFHSNKIHHSLTPSPSAIDHGQEGDDAPEQGGESEDGRCRQNLMHVTENQTVVEQIQPVQPLEINTTTVSNKDILSAKMGRQICPQRLSRRTSSRITMDQDVQAADECSGAHVTRLHVSQRWNDRICRQR